MDIPIYIHVNVEEIIHTNTDTYKKVKEYVTCQNWDKKMVINLLIEHGYCCVKVINFM